MWEQPPGSPQLGAFASSLRFWDPL
jgi:hypothetical protein